MRVHSLFPITICIIRYRLQLQAISAEQRTSKRDRRVFMDPVILYFLFSPFLEFYLHFKELCLIWFYNLLDLLIQNFKSTYGRGGSFCKVQFFLAFSDVMVIIDEVSTLQRVQFSNSGPHPAILLLTHPIEK